MRKNDPQGSRQSILDAAEQLFLARGYAGTSMSEIAKASGVTKSLIHHHFGSKQALWREIKRLRFADYHERQMEVFARAEPSSELLRESMAVYFRFLRDNPGTVRLMSWLQLEGERDITEMIRQLRDAGIEQVSQAQKAGVVRSDIPAGFILVTFLGFINAWFADPSMERTQESADAYLDSAWKLFDTGVLAAR